MECFLHFRLAVLRRSGSSRSAIARETESLRYRHMEKEKESDGRGATTRDFSSSLLTVSISLSREIRGRANSSHNSEASERARIESMVG